MPLQSRGAGSKSVSTIKPFLSELAAALHAHPSQLSTPASVQPFQYVTNKLANRAMEETSPEWARVLTSLGVAHTLQNPALYTSVIDPILSTFVFDDCPSSDILDPPTPLSSSLKHEIALALASFTPQPHPRASHRLQCNHLNPTIPSQLHSMRV